MATLPAEPVEHREAVLEGGEVAEVEVATVEGVAELDLVGQGVVIARPPPLVPHLEVRVVTQRLHDVDDPVAAVAGLAVRQGAQVRPQQVQRSRHRGFGVLQRDAAHQVH